MHGWTGKILNVDLTHARAWREDLPMELLHAYIGGRGLGVRLLRDRFRIDPFDPEMPLVFATGPLCGTRAPTSAQMSIVSRSPLTGTVSASTCCGGFPLGLKGAGLDAIRITGEAKSPVVLAVKGDEADIIPADALWGKEVGVTIRALSSRGSVAAIGPAGEKGVLFAGIMTGSGDCRVRGGLGAVMGRKKLKAVVVNGDSTISVARRGRFDSAVQDMMRLFRASPVLFGELGLGRYGTAAFVDLTSQRRMTPTENFRRTYFEGSSGYSGAALKKFCDSTDEGCPCCPVSCRKRQPGGEPFPDYDTLSHFGALNGIKSLPVIVKACRDCFELGLDPISAAATIAAWGEWRGRFADGYELPGILRDIVVRQGEGELLALGSRRAMDALGAPELSMSVKSLELPAYDPRGAYGVALAYSTSNRGGCHLAALPISHEILRKPVPTDRFSFSGKARINKMAEDSIAAVDSVALCVYSMLGATMEEFSELLTATTGLEYTSLELSGIGKRIFLTERFYNCSNGFSSVDDRLPERFHCEPGSSGSGIEVPPIDRQAFMEELQKYYGIRGLTTDGTFAADDLLQRLP